MAQATGTGSPVLRRDLSRWQVLAVSVGLMAPSMAANINPQGAEPSVGAAIPLTFLLAMGGVLLVSYGFVRLTQHFHTSGSVYGFVGATLGARAGAVSGWALMGTYMFLGVTAAVTGGRFVVSLLASVGGWTDVPDGAAYVTCVVILLAGFALAVIPAKRGTRVILSVEAVTVTLILVVSAIVVIRLAGGSAPGHAHFSATVFRIPKGTSFGALGFGAVFGFLSFVGFEASAALGEEAARPRRDIPRAILGTAAVGGVFYVLISALEVLGYGTSKADLTAFANSSSLFGHLGSVYTATWLGDIVTLGTAISALGCALACTVGASRLVYSLVRDGTAAGHGRHPLARVSPRWGTPVAATVVVTAIMLATTAALGLGGISSLNAFIYTATIGTLMILAVYVVVTVGAIRLLWLSGRREAPWVEAVIPVLGIAVLGYTLYRNVWPYPGGALGWLPVISAAWMALALAAVLVSPSLGRRLGERLAADDGLRPLGAGSPSTVAAPPGAEPAGLG